MRRLSWGESLRWRRWQWWPVIRNALLIVGTYVAGVVSVVFAFPLWMWVMIEAALRYFPFWLQLGVLIFLGVQLDWLLAWPLGLGFVLVSGVWLGLVLGRRWRQTIAFLVWHLVWFTIFFAVTMQLWSGVTMVTFGWSLLLYVGMLLIRIRQGQAA